MPATFFFGALINTSPSFGNFRQCEQPVEERPLVGVEQLACSAERDKAGLVDFPGGTARACVGGGRAGKAMDRFTTFDVLHSTKGNKRPGLDPGLLARLAPG